MIVDIDKYSENRPWGRFERFCKEKRCSVKLIFIKPKESLSLQYYNKREEFLKIIQGEATVTVGDKKSKAKANDEFYIDREVLHKIKAKEKAVVVLEISFGEQDEDDVVRIKDKYKRF